MHNKNQLKVETLLARLIVLGYLAMCVIVFALANLTWKVVRGWL